MNAGRRRRAARSDLGQYFTPRPVADFALDALAVLGLSPGRVRVVDPACGDGVFLDAARQRLPEAELWGCDLDASLEAPWRAAGLTEPRAHMLVQDGLTDAPWYGLTSGTFDLVIGNPPYGFGVPRPKAGEPIEAVFLRRFVELARAGGWLAVVVPEGIVANARSQRLRDWLLKRVALAAVVALPETTFAAEGTRARTALLLARKGKAAAKPVLLAEPAAGGACPRLRSGQAPPSEQEHSVRGRRASRLRCEGSLCGYLESVLKAIRNGANDVPAGRGERAG